MTSIGLVQINNSFSGQCYLPYAAGLLQAYLQAHLTDPGRVRFMAPVYVRRPVARIVDDLQGADVVLFSVYVWNLRLSLAVAERLKAEAPDTLIVFGGPQVPDAAATFLRDNPAVDVAVSGEGEPAALQIVEHWRTGDWRRTPGVSYRDESGRIASNPKGPRLSDLDVIPSPFLTGVFDPLMRAHPDQRWIALWETNRGCPFSCTFCDWGAATASKVRQFDRDRLEAEIDWFARHEIEFVFCCDANFGILPRDLDLAHRVAATKVRTGFPRALSVQGTKNATERAYEVQKTLADAGLNKGVTLSMQSLDVGTLQAVKRANIKLDTYRELQRRFTRDRIETYADLILGLPNETYDSFVDGVAELVEHGQHNRIQFNNLTVLPNSPMADPDDVARHRLDIIESPIVNIHGSLADADHDIVERQPLVVGSATMPRADWVRTRAFSWMTALLHFDKVFQIPLVLARELAGVSYRGLLEGLAEDDVSAWPVLNGVRQFFRDYATAIQQGGPEYVRSERFLNIYWPADEFVLIRLVASGDIDRFYDEAGAALLARLGDVSPRAAAVLDDAVALNRALLKRPFVDDRLEVPLRFNVWECYRSALVGDPVELEPTASTAVVDRATDTWWSWDDYCREVIWWGNKKGAYLYDHEAGADHVAADADAQPTQLAGIY